ncbi:hypothetical protein P5V15_010928 [Pogonomyrmex californicus]
MRNQAAHPSASSWFVFNENMMADASKIIKDHGTEQDNENLDDKNLIRGYGYILMGQCAFLIKKAIVQTTLKDTEFKDKDINRTSLHKIRRNYSKILSTTDKEEWEKDDKDLIRGYAHNGARPRTSRENS